MKVVLKPAFPGKKGMRALWEKPAGGGEEPGARFQLFVTLCAFVFFAGNCRPFSPRIEQISLKVPARLRDQRRDRQVAGGFIQPPHNSFSQPPAPAVQRTAVWMTMPHMTDRLFKAQMRQVRVRIGRATCLDHRQRISLERRDLHRQHAKTPFAHVAAAQRYRREMILDASRPLPKRTTVNQPSCI